MALRIPFRFSILAGTLALLAPACAQAPGADPGTGDTSSTTPPPSTGGGGTGGTGGGPVVDGPCALDGDVSSASWAQTVGPDDAIISAFAATSKALFAGTAGGVLRSDDGGTTWSRVSGVPVAEITAIAASGADVFVATSKELFLGENHGASWKPISGGIPVDPYLGLRVFYLNASGGDVFALAGEHLPYRWDAAAQKWNAMPVALYDALDVIESDGTSIYANSNLGDGVRIFTGTGWDPVPAIPAWGYRAFAFRGAVGFAGNDANVVRSLDGGLTWNPLLGLDKPMGPVLDLLTTPTAVFVATASGVFTSLDDGESWTSLSVPATSWSPMSLASDGVDVFWGDVRVHRSSDQGANWTLAAPLRASTVLNLVSGDGVLYAHTQQGPVSLGHAYRSTDAGTTWNEITSLPDPGLVAMSRFTLAANGADVYATRGFLGLLHSPDHGLSWKSINVPANLTGEPLSHVLVAGGALFAASMAWEGGPPLPGTDGPTHLASAGLYRSADGGKSWKDANDGLPVVQMYQGEPRYDEIVALREVGSALFLSTAAHGLWRSTDQGSSWVAANNGLPIVPPGHPPAVRAVVSIGSGLLAAGDTMVARSTDGGATWAVVDTAGLPAGSSIRDVVTYEGRAFMTVDGAKGGVFWSSDGAAWARVGSGLEGAAGPLLLDGATLFGGVDGRAVWKLPLPGCKTAN